MSKSRSASKSRLPSKSRSSTKSRHRSSSTSSTVNAADLNVGQVKSMLPQIQQDEKLEASILRSLNRKSESKSRKLTTSMVNKSTLPSIQKAIARCHPTHYHYSSSRSTKKNVPEYEEEYLARLGPLVAIEEEPVLEEDIFVVFDDDDDSSDTSSSDDDDDE